MNMSNRRDEMIPEAVVSDYLQPRKEAAHSRIEQSAQCPSQSKRQQRQEVERIVTQWRRSYRNLYDT